MYNKNIMKLDSKYIIVGVSIIVILLVIAGEYFFTKYQNSKVDPQAQSQQEVKKILAEVGKLIDLPSGEDPTLATVTDADKLKDQPFFKNAKNGDKVLIY